MALRNLKAIICVTISFFIASCSSLTFVSKGVDTKHPDTFSLIRDDSIKNNTQINEYTKYFLIVGKNGESLGSNTYKYYFPRQAYLTEGSYKLVLQHNHRGMKAHGCVSLEVKKGHYYLIESKAVKYSVSFWVRDEKSNEVVSKNC